MFERAPCEWGSGEQAAEPRRALQDPPFRCRDHRTVRPPVSWLQALIPRSAAGGRTSIVPWVPKARRRKFRKAVKTQGRTGCCRTPPEKLHLVKTSLVPENSKLQQNPIKNEPSST